MSEDLRQAPAPERAEPGSAPAAFAAKPPMPAWRLVVTLTLAGALAASLLSVAYQVTLPTIEANKSRVLQEAVREVLKGAEKIESLRVTPRGLESEAEVHYEVSGKTPNRVFEGFDAAGKRIGFALAGEAYGYGSDPIRLIFGYDASTHEIIGFKVLDEKETPGIGAKIETDDFSGLFWRSGEAPGAAGDRPARQPPLVGKRHDQFVAANPHEVDMISGATISSRAVIKIINDVVGTVGERVDAYARDRRSPGGGSK